MKIREAKTYKYTDRWITLEIEQTVYVASAEGLFKIGLGEW